MNIFFLDWNPRRCARWHCDKHVVKMILESCQLLYTAHWVLTDQPEPPYIHCAPRRGYRPTHTKHPCLLWVIQSLDNYRWLVRLTFCLVQEYRHRYGSHKVHACEAHLDWLSVVEPQTLLSRGLTPPAQAMPPEYHSSDPTVAYRAFYKHNKDRQRKIVAYTKRHRPHFLD